MLGKQGSSMGGLTPLQPPYPYVEALDARVIVQPLGKHELHMP
jgi:hypothetical protein